MYRFPNRVQRAVLDLLEACEDSTLALSRSNPSLLGPGAWSAKALRDFATTCFLLPQRSGKTMLTHLAAGSKDVIVFASETLLKEHASYDSPGIRVVGFDNLPCLKDTPRLWVMDAFWTSLLKGPDDNTRKVYEKIAHASSHNYVSIILCDSPF